MRVQELEAKLCKRFTDLDESLGFILNTFYGPWRIFRPSENGGDVVVFHFYRVILAARKKS